MLVVAAAIAIVFVFFGGGLGDISLTPAKMTVQAKVSVVYYNGEPVSARLIVNGDGELETRHRIKKEDVGMAYYEEKELIEGIQSASKSRFIPAGKGFTNDVVTGEIKIKSK